VTVQWVCGVDEAGRGPLAGPVYAAAAILDPLRPIEGLKDSKKLSHRQLERLAPLIQERCIAWAIASASAAEIDQINILQASLLAMKRAVALLGVKPALALVDGNQAPKLDCIVRTIIKGDSLEPAISAASILAKTARDAHLRQMHLQYPHYGFDQHKGYPTAKHRLALIEHGPCIEHRRSFITVAQCLKGVDASPA
jgi:ribonuclease HII